jgi:hypothetical protein
MVERFDQGMPYDPESAARIIPNRDAEFVAGLGQAQKSIAAVAADVAARPGADLAPRSAGSENPAQISRKREDMFC